MSVQTAVRSVATPEQQVALGRLMAEPETSVSDAPLYSPQAAGLALLLALLLVSPSVPEEPKKK
ncbi:hypothetical protein ALI22I_20980 [Saccharothrix sp. ALI-22-I]|uniref:hypothetical protein n=1 Tax=Saccharothrix sp. ALI-22-I TaxID=1933778 RepID=UPI00097C5BC6|nr:hypothetical protein [Saccharothrix sp. ALI-22-I]ONI87799.1 hypothetical protein ALI22I_20980 [Saccharothrix sp. ALI-22-I]